MGCQRLESTHHLEVDLCVYFIQHEEGSGDIDDPNARMNVHLATCRSEILHASDEMMDQVRARLQEVIADATKYMLEWP